MVRRAARETIRSTAQPASMSPRSTAAAYGVPEAPETPTIHGVRTLRRYPQHPRPRPQHPGYREREERACEPRSREQSRVSSARSELASPAVASKAEYRARGASLRAPQSRAKPSIASARSELASPAVRLRIEPGSPERNR